jgi:hypothetical protein
MQFIFCPDPSEHWCSQEWAAKLFVKCGDVPSLMVDGFYWDDANVVSQDTFTDGNIKNGNFRLDEKRWYGTGHYFLRDLVEPPRWIATIEVFTLTFKTLRYFDLGRLRRHKIYYGLAVNEAKDQIYTYYHDQHPCCLSVIYKGTPRDGEYSACQLPGWRCGISLNTKVSEQSVTEGKFQSPWLRRVGL